MLTGAHVKPNWTLAMILTLSTLSVSAEIIDRILAVVDGSLITLSDARGVVRMGLEPTPATGDAIAATLQTLIDRHLVLSEVDRYGPPEPPTSEIQARVAMLRGRFADAREFETALEEAGMRVEDMERYVRDSLRIESYLGQRFTASIQPREEDLVQYYREHAAAFTRDGVARPFDEVRAEVRARFVAERRDTLVREWLEGLRRRANITTLYLPR
jgi:hypothetical protein